MVVTCQSVGYYCPIWESEPLKQEIIQPDGSSKFEYIKDNEGQWVYTKVKPEPGPQYYSERGEDCPPRLDPDLFEYLSKGEEFAYVFEGGTWICYDLHEFDSEEPEIVEIPQVL